MDIASESNRTDNRDTKMKKKAITWILSQYIIRQYYSVSSRYIFLFENILLGEKEIGIRIRSFWLNVRSYLCDITYVPHGANYVATIRAFCNCD